ncbi:hypothetical protein I316_05357 [Kwoniella heveanensis BCC8398]|uniref:C3H1-type domain-containing protein n=1 Tax=Kwoniella heveanensis BCC8398 TaxID=1296120 RepID=A0A1B9GPJ7_9TREE|nr:hypothetical protein I316_05357 [Kwoniella heveanensis BCC8398]
MDDLVGSDFDPAFLDWLFDQASNIAAAAPAPLVSEPVSTSAPAQQSTASPAAPRQPASAGGSRMLNTALAPLSSQPEKRKAETQEGSNKKRLSDVVAAPSGPRALGEGRGLADRIGGLGPAGGAVRPGFGNGQNVRGRGVPIRGMAGGRGGMGQGRGMNHMGGFRPNFPQQPQNLGMMQPGFGQPFMAPGQQEMMAQMMMMQASMAQMGEMMAQMAEERQQMQQATPSPVPTPTAVRPPRPPAPAKLPHGTKLGGHSVSAIPPKSSTPGPIPDKPSSTALCRYSVGCSNSRCPFSHPSPVADEKTGMVLSEEACENGKSCKDAECVKSHVSPAAALGDNAGPSRLLCKYQNCTNPSCPFRHEDAAGNPIPPPALSAAKAAKEAKAAAAPSSDNEDGEFEVVMSHKGLMDGALDDSKKEVACRYGERCTRSDCKFSHPDSRPVPKAKKSLTGFNKSITSTNGGGIGGGMHMSKKFATPLAGAGAASTTTTKSLNPGAGEFKPSAPVPAAAEKDLEVTI